MKNYFGLRSVENNDVFFFEYEGREQYLDTVCK